MEDSEEYDKGLECMRGAEVNPITAAHYGNRNSFLGEKLYSVRPHLHEYGFIEHGLVQKRTSGTQISL